MTDISITVEDCRAVIEGHTERGKRYVGSIFVRGMVIQDERVIVLPHVAENVKHEARGLGLTIKEEFHATA